MPGRSPPVAPAAPSASSRRSLSRLRLGKPELRSFSLLALEGDASTALLDETLRDRQAQPRAFRHTGMRPEVTLEHLSLRVLRYTETVAPCAHLPPSRALRLDPLRLDADPPVRLVRVSVYASTVGSTSAAVSFRYAGTTKWNVYPSPSVLSNQMRPPVCSISWRVIARPNPVPSPTSGRARK